MYQRIIGYFIILLNFLFSSFSIAQSAFIPMNDDYEHLIDRLEIKRGRFSEGFNYNVKPFERKAVVALTDSILKEGTVSLTARDWDAIDYLREDSWEWTKGFAATDSVKYNQWARLGWYRKWRGQRQPKYWKHAADLYGQHSKDWDLHFNFVTNNFIGFDDGAQSNKALFFTGRGIELRGMINEKLGFYTFVADNQGLFPQYVRSFSPEYSFPGEGLSKTTKNGGSDFLSARGYITFKPLKYINVKFGNDYQSFGSGYRSMILSNNSSPYLFLRMDTRFGKFQYTNLWTSMINDQSFTGRDGLRSKKFAAIHHLSVNITDKINLGIFEAEVFSRDSVGGGYDLNYLNPIIFYRYVESYIGSEDNALIGLDFRWLLNKKMSIYSQFMLDEFLTKYMFNGSKSWTNKYALQIGSKYVDAFEVPDLDLQLEYNLARPYVYSHKDGGRNYAHYGQALAHPLGANFRELLAIARYRVNSRLSAYGTLMFADQGKDIPYSERSYGGDLMKSYDSRYFDEGNKIGQGVSTKTSFADLRVSYALAHNLFLDGRMLYRKVHAEEAQYAAKSHVFSLALRYNMAYRQQTY
ncbi:hypothetical protein CLV98_11467 [Dyadobacter jejuensis]|uniref:Capsule assembly protein Wzi n=1 Tax=Dyadobacter jejuensis TaxID=1082580 RepID=A0A316ADG6_9BACT|nr:hypothetical protein [Dyadobacter jejuensis]PWJ55298.1 hypothetical protein CLV98_11467 [Dyadobacter jejuensis]